MEKWQALSTNRRLFDVGSRLGSLEGYLYSEEKVDKSYLKNWLDNIDREFNQLPPGLKQEIQGDYLEILRKVEALLKRLYGDKDADTLQVTRMIGTLKEQKKQPTLPGGDP
ncbi:MAG: hypothetical protein HYT78_16440 [Deltaproteobacteria bacterium]|nr:hypothetical protein [Deltaproteobacteria bacterium]